MARKKKKEQFYSSMSEVEKQLFPKSSEERLRDISTDFTTIATRLADKSLDTVRRRLAK